MRGSSFKVSLLAAGLAAAMAVSAQPVATPGAANAPANCPMQPRGGQRGGVRRQPLTAEQLQARFDSVTTQQAQALQITAAQRPQWNAYVQAKKSMFNDMAARRNTVQGQDFASMTAEQRADLYARHMEAAAQHSRQVANSTKTLRDVLTPEQRTRFDQMSTYGKRDQGQGRLRGAQRSCNKPAAAQNQQATPAIKR